MEKKIKTILILGGHGFIATNVIKHIEQNHLPYRVIVFDLTESHPHGITSPVIEKCYSGDFSNASVIEQIFRENTIDIVMHAISTTVASNAENSRYDIESNVFPSLFVLDMMVKYGVKDIVFISSGGAIYGTPTDYPHREQDAVFPISPYGVSKSIIEQYLMSYHERFGLRPLILRLSNPYGMYHYSMKQGAINVALQYAREGRVFQVYGDGNGKKDYIWMPDFLSIFFQLLAREKSTIVNIGSGELLSLNQILEAIKQYYPAFEWEYKSSMGLDVQNFELDLTYLKHLLPGVTFSPFANNIPLLVQQEKNE